MKHLAGRSVHRGAALAMALFCGTTLLFAAPAAKAADLDRDYQRYGAYDEEDWDDRDYRHRHAYRDERGCASRQTVRRRLQSAGWHDFEDARATGGIAVVEARHDTGRRYRLSIDRCSGEVVDAKPLGGHRWADRGKWRERKWGWRRDHDDRWRRWADGPRSWRARGDIY